ncbi:hypothetical protein GGX14DRAFT_572938 [Mycena pura]|uniref:Uncharacterized protein n=1 Tax=Mycena pura TaxID=153505 RepID=A0AAD6V4B7_9AGAR|nr:hypothetical protein GGX14DRAFT_572938 [Mycena pura]
MVSHTHTSRIMPTAFPALDLTVILFTFAILLVAWTVRRWRSSSEPIACIPGPKSRSWIFGNMLDLLLALVEDLGFFGC